MGHNDGAWVWWWKWGKAWGQGIRTGLGLRMALGSKLFRAKFPKKMFEHRT